MILRGNINQGITLRLLDSKNHTKKEKKQKKKLYIYLLVSLKTLLLMTFSAKKLIMFYILFEATLIANLIIIITR